MSVNSVKHAIASGLAGALDGLLAALGRNLRAQVVNDLADRARLRAGTPAGLDVRLVSPDYVRADAADEPLARRILAAYAKAKADQGGRDPVFRPSTMWRDQIESAYAALIDGAKRDDLGAFLHFLSNFGCWEVYTGIESTDVVRANAADPARKTWFENQVIAPQVAWWQAAESDGRPLSELSYPRFGNQCGATVDGAFVGLGSVANDLHARVIAQRLSGPHPVIAEIGGGYGKLFYFLSRRLRHFCYLDFDLPETLCCASYFLMKAFPESRFLLYGEGEFGPEALEGFDFILLPSFEIGGLPDRAVDMFLNKNSLGEMSPDLCRLFVGEICRTTEYFWHLNHEFVRNTFGDGTASLLNGEYPVPESEFDLVTRHIDTVNCMGDDGFNYGNDIYSYLYARRREVPPPDG